MILSDLNLLIHAYHLDSPRHRRAVAWWEGVLSGQELVALAWLTILGFLRVTTNRYVLDNPLPVEEALAAIESWLQQPDVRVINPTQRHPEILGGFVRTAGTAGNLTTDAHLAALALEHRCTLHSTDNDFARFPGLSWRNPLQG